MNDMKQSKSFIDTVDCFRYMLASFCKCLRVTPILMTGQGRIASEQAIPYLEKKCD